MLDRPILWIHSVDMPAATMFSKFKSSGTTAPQNPFDNNPITQHFEIGKQVGSCGPEYVWKIYDCIRKNDGRVSITIFNSSIQLIVPILNQYITRNSSFIIVSKTN